MKIDQNHQGETMSKRKRRWRRSKAMDLKRRNSSRSSSIRFDGWCKRCGRCWWYNFNWWRWWKSWGTSRTSSKQESINRWRLLRIISLKGRRKTFWSIATISVRSSFQSTASMDFAFNWSSWCGSNGWSVRKPFRSSKICSSIEFGKGRKKREMSYENGALDQEWTDICHETKRWMTETSFIKTFMIHPHRREVQFCFFSFIVSHLCQHAHRRVLAIQSNMFLQQRWTMWTQFQSMFLDRTVTNVLSELDSRYRWRNQHVGWVRLSFALNGFPRSLRSDVFWMIFSLHISSAMEINRIVWLSAVQIVTFATIRIIYHTPSVLNWVQVRISLLFELSMTIVMHCRRTSPERDAPVDGTVDFFSSSALSFFTFTLSAVETTKVSQSISISLHSSLRQVSSYFILITVQSSHSDDRLRWFERRNEFTAWTSDFCSADSVAREDRFGCVRLRL